MHFAGHAVFAEEPKGDGRGYLVFSGHPRPQAVPIAAVATWLADAGVQLVYLSCCRSSAALVALEFARNNIPMAIGFHWDVDDSKAPVFAKEFYQELLKSRLKVCPAISRARLNLFNGSSGGDPIWASPVLIAQPMDWIQVEGVLKSGVNPDLQAAKCHIRAGIRTAGRFGTVRMRSIGSALSAVRDRAMTKRIICAACNLPDAAPVHRGVRRLDASAWRIVMPLQRGQVQAYDFDRMIVEFTMLNEGKVIHCAISTGAMDGLENRRDVKADQRVDQFMRLRDIIEERASRRFFEHSGQSDRRVVLRSNDF